MKKNEDTNDFNAQKNSMPDVSKKKGRKRDWSKAILDASSKIGSVTPAATAAGVTRQAVYMRNERDPKFRARYKEALAESTERMEAIAVVRATQQATPSDILLMFLLKGRKPEVYRERHDIQHTGAGGGPIGVTFSPEDREQLGSALEKRIAQRMEERARFVDGMAPVAVNGNGKHNGNGNGNGFSDPH